MVLSLLGWCMGMYPRSQPVLCVVHEDHAEEGDDTVEVAMDWDILSL
jgi:hypothetical protein